MTETDARTARRRLPIGIQTFREIRRWYNGYNWLGDEKVYNPFDILLLFRRREFGAWWFETGTPTFLVDTLVERGVGSLALERMTADDALLSAFDVGAVGTEALLFQTGYLTIEAEEHRGGETAYRLGYPNREVRQSLNKSLLSRLAVDPSAPVRQRLRLYDLLQAGDFDGLKALLKAFFAGIPYQWHVRNDIADYEGYYASVFYALFAAAGLDLTVEDSTSRGRVDLGRPARRPGLPVRVQSGGAGPGRRTGPADVRDGAVARAGLRGQVPRRGRAGALDRGRVQQADPQRRGVRGGTGVTMARRALPSSTFKTGQRARCSTGCPSRARTGRPRRG